MEVYDENNNTWNEWRDGMQGYLLYDKDMHMALHLTTKGYEKADLDFPNFSDTISIVALKHLSNSYTYFAKYSIDQKEKIVEHNRISHSNPKEWNLTVHRKFSFKGDTLILKPVEEKNSTLRLKWIRD